jgi:nucleoside-diphosphate-sugar epimerase
MMRALVTGVAGFVGSSIADALRARGDTVVGVDCFTPYYARAVKESNLGGLRADDGFDFVEADLRAADVGALLGDVDVVFHLAAQPGARSSWGGDFDGYVSHNVLATQRLLEAARGRDLKRFVYASSSSVYGNAPEYPTTEDGAPRPHSPYGVTKLAAEQLCNVYAANWGLPTVALRYFTVFGPRQRPDMAIHRMVAAALTGRVFSVYGDGGQRRDFTFVGDVVEATLRSVDAELAPGTVVNVASGRPVAVRELIELVGDVVGRRVDVAWGAAEPGDVQETGGAIDRAFELLEWRPGTELRDGLRAQAVWEESTLVASEAPAPLD